MSAPVRVTAGVGALNEQIQLKLFGAGYDFTALVGGDIPDLLLRHPALPGVITCDATADTIALPFHRLNDDDRVMVRGPATPAGIDVNYLYYVTNSTGKATATGTFQLSVDTGGGSNIALLTAGGAGTTVAFVARYTTPAVVLGDGTNGRDAPTSAEAWLLLVCDSFTFPRAGIYDLWSDTTSGALAQSMTTQIEAIDR